VASLPSRSRRRTSIVATRLSCRGSLGNLASSRGAPWLCAPASRPVCRFDLHFVDVWHERNCLRIHRSPRTCCQKDVPDRGSLGRMQTAGRFRREKICVSHYLDASCALVLVPRINKPRRDVSIPAGPFFSIRCRASLSAPPTAPTTAVGTRTTSDGSPPKRLPALGGSKLSLERR
jgi:hypothetical protein